MDADWIKSPTGRRVVLHWADARPAWLWSGDGSSLIWRNAASCYFNARIKKQGLKLLPDPVPIRGQVARLIRLGMLGRTSLSRIQFIAGGRPLSETCACTPLHLPDGQDALLVVGVDPVPAEVLDLSQDFCGPSENFLPPDAEFILVDAQQKVIAQSSGSPPQEQALPALQQENGALFLAGASYELTRLKASPEGATLLLLERKSPATPPAATDESRPQAVASEPSHIAQAPAPPEPESRSEPEEPGPLTALFDRLMQDENLYASVEDSSQPWEDEGELADEEAPAGLAPEVEPDAEADDEEAFASESEDEDVEVASEEPVEAPALAAASEHADLSRKLLIRLVGRGFNSELHEKRDQIVPAAVPVEPPTAQDRESVERVSRYNFDELARILNDRVSGEPKPRTGNDAPDEATAPDEHPPSLTAAEGQGSSEGKPPVAPQQATGSLVNIGGETLVLNRLPLGILVFRDQQILFANRAITEMTGYESVERLRAAGLSAIFPDAGDDQQPGPINHLVQRDGTLVPVTARLQSVSWQARPALMLSASATEVRTGHEAAVRAFAESIAQMRGDGFIETTRNGVISQATAEGLRVLGRSEQQLLGRPLTVIVNPDDVAALRAFFERPARFAEAARPSILLRGATPGTEILVYAQGQAGIVTGYMVFVRRLESAARLQLPRQEGGMSPALLAKVSRSIRRPLNTVIGFSDLIRSAAFGPIENERYLEYAQDISTAGHEIATLIDELDDYARLQDGRFAPNPANTDLSALLEYCGHRVRSQANAAQVLVRSAISERLPGIVADKASLSQAVLNLLASAIDQSPRGGSVVLSAQLEDDGTVLVHVRDSARTSIDLSDRFVVFRDGIGRDGSPQGPVRSSVGLALTRALVAVNGCTLSVGPAGGIGTLFTLTIPASLVSKPALEAPAATNE